VANKETIQDVDARMRELIIRIARDANELNTLRDKRRKMVAGKIKVPPPPPTIVKWQASAFDDRLDDLHPVAPGASGPC
jgi:hypothetical protein